MKVRGRTYVKAKDKEQDKAIMTLKKQVRRLKVHDEHKYHDEYFPRASISYLTNSTTTLFDPAQGSTNQTRIGNEASCYRINLQGIVEASYASTLEPQQVRISVIQSKEGFVPSTTATSAAQKTYAVPATSYTVNVPFDDNNRKHFVVLWDKTFTLNNTNGTGCIGFKKSIKVSRRTVFEEAGSTTAEKGQIYVLATTSSPSATPAIVGWYARCHFKG